MDNLLLDIGFIIFNQLDFIDQCVLRLVSTYFLNYPITNLMDRVPNKQRLNNTILKLYPYVVKLDAYNNYTITDISHLKHLKVLNAGYKSGICDVANLINLTELHTNDHNPIKNICTLTGLRILTSCHVNNDDIEQLTNLTELNVTLNENITNVSKLIKLKKLYGDYSEIDNHGLGGLTNLTICCGSIHNDGIRGLTNLVTLDITCNRNITNVNTLVSLRKLYVYKGNINKNDIFLTGLVNLTISNDLY